MSSAMSGHRRRSIVEAKPQANPPVPGLLEIVPASGDALNNRPSGARTAGRGRYLGTAGCSTRLGLNLPRFLAVSAGRLLRTWMKIINKPYGCFCHQLSIVTPNNGMYFGCASLLE
jgi:hypothetical protein